MDSDAPRKPSASEKEIGIYPDVQLVQQERKRANLGIGKGNRHISRCSACSTKAGKSSSGHIRSRKGPTSASGSVISKHSDA